MASGAQSVRKATGWHPFIGKRSESSGASSTSAKPVKSACAKPISWPETGANGGASGDANGWVVIDGTGKTCAGILAALNAQIETDSFSFIEVIIPDVLNTYDVVVWAEERSHSVLTQRKDEVGTTRMLIKP